MTELQPACPLPVDVVVQIMIDRAAARDFSRRTTLARRLGR